MTMNASYRTMEGHTGAVKSVSRVDHTRVLSGGDDKKAFIWDINDGSHKPFETHNNPIESVLSLGQHVITGDAEGFLRIFDIRNGTEPIHKVKPHTRPIRKLVHMNPTTIASASVDGKICVTSVINGKPLLEMQNNESIYGFGQLADPRLLAVGTENHIHVWNASNGKKMNTYTTNSPTYAILGRYESGLFIAGTEAQMNGAVSVMHYKQGVVKRFSQAHNGKVNAFAHVQVPHLFVSGASDGVMKVWDMNNPNKCVTLENGHERSINALTHL